MLAHDIRTALTGILSLSELLASSNIGERERSWAKEIKIGAEHLAALTTLAVDVGRANAGSFTLQQQIFRPRALVEALAQSLQARAATKALSSEVKIEGELPGFLLGDAIRLRAALENLIDNAVKFTERGSVRLEAAALPASRGKSSHIKLVLSVVDTGIGLTAAEIRRLCRPFAQANAEVARRYGGAGLGLSMVKALAKRMGGDLKIVSERGRGSRFGFSAVLPLATAAAQDPAGRFAPVAMPQLSILCAEDNPYGRVILNTILTELGHRVDFVATGEEAVIAAARGYDLVLMDITLGGIDGVEAVRRIRALPGAPARIPVIGISGRSEEGDEEKAKIAGMNAYLRKPLSPSTLNMAIAAVVSARG